MYGIQNVTSTSTLFAWVYPYRFLFKLERTLSDGASVVTEYMNPSDWLSLLLKRYPQLIAGGASPLEDQLEGFWEAYRLQHPSHEVFQKQCQLGHVVPSAFGVMRAEGPEGVATWKVALSAPLVFQSRMLIALAVIHSSLCTATGSRTSPNKLIV